MPQKEPNPNFRAAATMIFQRTTANCADYVTPKASGRELMLSPKLLSN
jgi:hypothetical protein